MICNKNHRYNELFETLNDSQAGEERHICCGCAYERGYSDGFNGKEQIFPDDLPESQAGTVRHKDARQAYNLGYMKGKKDRKK
ncbi:MAG: hypothetical protein SO183_01325 [Fusobacterium mortiferum]|nr:hypothetical protein [Fusobacterium mortiferum]MDY4800280.1 hypothetical protein [Fusobacterium mortiferum]MDY5980007.1 hypothetical protein [Fusobacterium mortiferum]